MPIEVTCPSCDKKYKVKDDAAGKKIRCKNCETVIKIPLVEQAEEQDPWDSVDEREQEEEPEPPPPPRRSSTSKSAKRSRKSSSAGLPVTIIASLSIIGLMMAFCLFSVFKMATSQPINLPGLVGVVLRILIDTGLILGLLNRINAVRWVCIALDCLGLGFTCLCLGAFFLVLPPEATKQIPPGDITLLIAVFAVQFVLWISDIVILLTPSAKEYFE